MSKVILSVTIPGELVERLDAQAESEYRSRSSLATALIAKGLESRESEARQESEAVSA